MHNQSHSREAARLFGRQQGFALATVDETRTPTISYVPFACIGGAFGVVVSRLAAHTVNLLARRPACVLLTDDPSGITDAYARVRLSIDVAVRPAATASAEADVVWTALEARHGEIVGVLRTLPDFHAIVLEPERGRLVLGFASAHDLNVSAITAALRASTTTR